MTSRWRIHKFALISGIGWTLDVVLFASLVAAGLRPLVANCMSAATAVVFVFAIAQRRTFVHDGSLILRKFGLYAAYNILGISLASLTVAFVAAWMLEASSRYLALDAGDLLLGFVPLIVAVSLAAKIVITPITLYANFLFMGWLLEGRPSFR